MSTLGAILITVGTIPAIPALHIGAGGAFLAEKVDCGSAYCRSSAQYTAAQGWMGSLEQSVREYRPLVCCADVPAP